MREREIRLRALDGLDPRHAELPHGTEVILRADRVVGERRLPQGSVGRVARNEGERVVVEFVGIGRVVCGRSELVPRRHGQALFSRRRAAGWAALAPCVVLEAVVGSHAWGLADEASDVDRRGVFALPFPWTAGLGATPEDMVSADGSASYWSVGKALRQGLRSDPNTLEALFVEGVRATDEIGEWLVARRDALVSREIYGSFGRYALAQLRRLAQHARLAAHRGIVLDWLRAEPALTLDQVAERLASSVPGRGSETDRVHQARQWVRQLYRSMADQGLLEGAEFAALARFARERSHAFELPRELRPKNAYNLLRLLATGTAWLATGAPSFVVSGAERETILAVKRGDVALERVLEIAEGMMPALEAARDASPLPERPDIGAIDELARRINEELARRWVSREPGPFGAGAPLPPPLEWGG